MYTTGKISTRPDRKITCRAHKHKILYALGQDLHAPGMRVRLNVEPCSIEFRAWISNYIPIKPWDVITHACADFSSLANLFISFWGM